MQEIIVYRSPVEPLMYEYGIPAFAVAIVVFAILYLFLAIAGKFIRMNDETKGMIVIGMGIFAGVCGFVYLWKTL